MAHPEFKTEPTSNHGGGGMTSGMQRGGSGGGRDIHGNSVPTSNIAAPGTRAAAHARA